jgi:hypothetical protein
MLTVDTPMPGTLGLAPPDPERGLGGLHELDCAACLVGPRWVCEEHAELVIELL